MGVKRGGGLGGKIGKLTSDMRAQLKPVVYAIAGAVQADAQISITTGAVSGKGHVPSRPGEPPNNDTGALANSIEVQPLNDLAARVIVGADYGLALEFGTSKMAERPYMRPAVKKNDPKGKAAMRTAVVRVIKGERFAKGG